MRALNDVPRHWKLRVRACSLVVGDRSGRIFTPHDLLLRHFWRRISVHCLEPALAVSICCFYLESHLCKPWWLALVQ